jgi:Lysozyme inhibitor LprI
LESIKTITSLNQKIGDPLARILCFIILFGFPMLSAKAGDMDENIYRSCYGEDKAHVDEKECVEKKAAASDVALKSAESAFLISLSKSDNDPQDITAIKNAFIAGGNAFQQYRHTYCDFYASLAAGGNSAGELRDSCFVVLNNQRTEDMHPISQSASSLTQSNPPTTPKD